jgi:hypothetical protein
MIQPQWPGLGPSYQPPSWGNAAPSGAVFGAAAQPVDGVGANWWEQNPSGGVGSSLGSGSQSSLVGMLQSLIGLLGQLVGSMFGGSGSLAGGSGSLLGGNGTTSGTTGYGLGSGFGTGTSPNCGQFSGQAFSDVTLTSTGDPHLGETGTRTSPGGPQAVNDHFDSMTSHGDLIDARSLAGGYRVSTTVTPPNANGVTSNQSATVHANCGRDAVTMNRDGSYSVTSNGQAVALAPGQSLALGGGENVTLNADGSLVVTAANVNGGSISTTLRATGSGVDVTAQAHAIRVGGDIVDHDPGSPAAPRHTPVRDAALPATT